MFCTDYMPNKCFLELNISILCHLAEFLYIPDLWGLVFNLMYKVTSFLPRKRVLLLWIFFSFWDDLIYIFKMLRQTNTTYRWSIISKTTYLIFSSPASSLFYDQKKTLLLNMDICILCILPASRFMCLDKQELTFFLK